MTQKITEDEILEAIIEAEILECAHEYPNSLHIMKVAERLCGAEYSEIERVYQNYRFHN